MTLCVRIFAFLFVLLLFGSCKKTLGPCTANCQVVYFSGIAVDPGAQKPLANLPVAVYMAREQSCMYCGDYEVISGKTRADGSFALTRTVDTTKVFYHYCTVQVQGPANYIVYPEPTGPGITGNQNTGVSSWPLPVDSTGTAPYEEYDFFQPVPLTIQLHRTGAIVASEPTLSLSFTLGLTSTSIWGLNENAHNADTSLTVNTGANVFTKVNYIQFVNDSTKVNVTDSIRCVEGANNTLVISYP